MVVAELIDDVSDTFLPSRRTWDGREPSTDRFLESNFLSSRSSSGLVIEPVDESLSSVKESISESVAPKVSELWLLDNGDGDMGAGCRPAELCRTLNRLLDIRFARPRTVDTMEALVVTWGRGRAS